MRARPLELELPGGRFSALEQGAPGAPPVLLAHGFPDLPSSFHAVAERLAAAGHHVVAPFLRGYAPSTLEGPFHMERIGADLVELAAAVSPSAPVALVGHDWGAVAAYYALTAAPSRFHRAATLSVPHPRALLRNLRRYPAQLRRSWYMGFLQLGAFAERQLRADDYALVTRLWRDWSPGLRPPLDHLAAVRRCFDASLPGPVEYYRALPRLALTRLPGRVETPLLYLHGAEDGCVAPELADGQARYFTAGYREERLPAAGHFLQLERPERVAELLLGWLSG